MKQPPAKKSSAKATSTKKSSTKAAPARKRTATKGRATRADFGTPIEGFFERQPPHLRAILDELRRVVEATAPEASAVLKWGMPCYELDGQLMCSLGAHKAHVNLVLFGPAAAFSDPEGLLAGEGKVGRHLKLTDVKALPKARVRGWVKAAAEAARAATR